MLKFGDIEDAIARANTSSFGLAAIVWSADLDQARAIAGRLDAGTVWINEAQYISPNVPFGGHKQSGIGLENGLERLLEYTTTQSGITPKSNKA